MMIKSIMTVALLIASSAPAFAQLGIASDPGRSERTRSDLQSLLAQYEEVLRSPVYSESVKRSVRENADRIRVRLERGDFRLGDRVVLYVQGEPDLPDTVSVEAGPTISLPLFGAISLYGVLRSEVEAHLTEELGKFIRDPVVRARGLMRMSIQGAVAQPGFYWVPADMLLGEAIMVAGGPAADARVDAVRIERGRQRLIAGDELQEAIREGLTLDQLNLQAGDQIVMPERAVGGIWTRLGVIAGIATSITFLIVRGAR